MTLDIGPINTEEWDRIVRCSDTNTQQRLIRTYVRELQDKCNSLELQVKNFKSIAEANQEELNEILHCSAIQRKMQEIARKAKDECYDNERYSEALRRDEFIQTYWGN